MKKVIILCLAVVALGSCKKKYKSICYNCVRYQKKTSTVDTNSFTTYSQASVICDEENSTSYLTNHTLFISSFTVDSVHAGERTTVTVTCTEQ